MRFTPVIHTSDPAHNCTFHSNEERSSLRERTGRTARTTWKNWKNRENELEDGIGRANYESN